MGNPANAIPLRCGATDGYDPDALRLGLDDIPAAKVDTARRRPRPLSRTVASGLELQRLIRPIRLEFVHMLRLALVQLLSCLSLLLPLLAAPTWAAGPEASAPAAAPEASAEAAPAA